MRFATIFPAASLLLGSAYGAPVAESELATRDLQSDSYGVIPTGSWSIVFGDGTVFGHSARVFVTSDDGTNIEYDMKCENGGDSWEIIPFGKLPWVISVHGGNACGNGDASYAYDNAWVNYASTHVNLPSDPRCQGVGKFNKSRRCLIPVNP